jgi:bifunctional non-homologous end joining protein LigD
VPWFPYVCRRVLHYDLSVPITFLAFDLLRIDGTDLTDRRFDERRELLVSLGLDGPGWATSETFADGNALYAGVCEHGLEGVVAKKRSGPYRSAQRGWVKVKNPAYWRRASEVDAMRRSRKRRTAYVAAR